MEPGITFNYEEFCREYGIPITEEYPEENEKKRAFYDAGMEYTRYCKAIELQRIKDSFETEVFGVEKEVGKVNGIISAIYQSAFGQDAYPTIEEKLLICCTL